MARGRGIRRYNRERVKKNLLSGNRCLKSTLAWIGSFKYIHKRKGVIYRQYIEGKEQEMIGSTIGIALKTRKRFSKFYSGNPRRYGKGIRRITKAEFFQLEQLIKFEKEDY